MAHPADLNSKSGGADIRNAAQWALILGNQPRLPDGLRRLAEKAKALEGGSKRGATDS